MYPGNRSQENHYNQGNGSRTMSQTHDIQIKEVDHNGTPPYYCNWTFCEISSQNSLQANMDDISSRFVSDKPYRILTHQTAESNIFNALSIYADGKRGKSKGNRITNGLSKKLVSLVYCTSPFQLSNPTGDQRTTTKSKFIVRWDETADCRLSK